MAPDFEYWILYVDGVEQQRGVRDEAKSFGFTVGAGTAPDYHRHTVSLYFYENCCSGRASSGYRGWDVTKGVQ